MERIYDDRSILGIEVPTLDYSFSTLLNSSSGPFINLFPVPSFAPHPNSFFSQLTEFYFQFRFLSRPKYSSVPSEFAPIYRVPSFSFETAFLTPFQAFPDFQLIPTETLLFDFSDSHLLIALFIQNPSLALFPNVFPPGVSGPRRRTPKSRPVLRRTRFSLDEDQPYLPRVQQKFKYRPHVHHAPSSTQPQAFSVTQGKTRRS